MKHKCDVIELKPACECFLICIFSIGQKTSDRKSKENCSTPSSSSIQSSSNANSSAKQPFINGGRWTKSGGIIIVFCIKHEHIACLYIITMNMARLGGQKIMKWLEIRLNKMLGLLPSQILLTFQTFGVTNSVQFLCDKWYDGLQ